MATEYEAELAEKINDGFYNLKAKIKLTQGDLTNLYAKLDAIHCHAYELDEQAADKFDWIIYAAKFLDDKFSPDGLVVEIEHLKKLSEELEAEKRADPFDTGVKNNDFMETVNNPVTSRK